MERPLLHTEFRKSDFGIVLITGRMGGSLEFTGFRSKKSGDRSKKKKFIWK